MHRFFLSLLIVATTVSGAFAQIFDPIDWSFKAERISETEAELTFTADIEGGWHLYSQVIDGDGPVPTSFTFKELGGAELVGKVSEGEGHSEMDENFGMILKYFEGKADFVQKVKVSNSATTISGELEFMVCNDERCLPPEYHDFNFNVPAAEGETVAPSEQGHNQESQIFEPVKWTFSQKDLGDGEFELQFSATIDDHWHVYSMHLPEETMTQPTVFEFDTLKGMELVGKVVEPEPITKFDPVNQEELSWFENQVTFTQKVKLTEEEGYAKGALNFMACDDEKCLAPEWIDFEFKITGDVAASDSEGSDKSWIGIFIAGFLGGLLALLTPCVFPMIPLTVSFFTKQSKSKAKGVTNALIYGSFIVFIYVVLGFLVTVTFG
ncbi:MAG: protein-disulfide reductase DsbD domain-containing protein, partial [Flavobacteriales bacterium]